MRQAEIERNTFETKIKLSLNLDAQEPVDIQTGVGFFDHMKNAAISNLNLCDSFINVRYTNDAGQNATETISNNCTNNLGVMTTVAEAACQHDRYVYRLLSA